MPETTTAPTASEVAEAMADLERATDCYCDLLPSQNGGHYGACNAELRPAFEVLRAALAETRRQLAIVYDAEWSRSDALAQRIEKMGTAGDALADQAVSAAGLLSACHEDDMSDATLTAVHRWRSVRGDAPTEPPAAAGPGGTNVVRSGVGRGFPRVHGRCPACRAASLFLAVGDHVTCASLSCPNPTAAADYLDRTVEDIAAAQDSATEPPAAPQCTCGEPTAVGVVHYAQAPCRYVEELYGDRAQVPVEAASWLVQALDDPHAVRGHVTDRAAAAVFAMVRRYDATGIGWGGERSAEDRSTEPPAVGLPVTLSSVDDVAAVCEQAGLTVTEDAYEDPAAGIGDDLFVRVEPGITGDRLSTVTIYRQGADDGQEVATLYPGSPTALLVDAIEAARGGSR